MLFRPNPLKAKIVAGNDNKNTKQRLGVEGCQTYTLTSFLKIPGHYIDFNFSPGKILLQFYTITSLARGKS